ncbi:MAG: helix-turn-helix domain-containing protein [Thermomicrobiales bacterium]
MTLSGQDAPRKGTHQEPGTLHDLRPPSFADLLRRYRTAAGLTQEELAERATLSARAISDLERGLSTRPQRETIRLLTAALGLDAEERVRLTQAARRATTSPSPPTQALVPGNLPTPPTPLIGREQAVAAAVARLRLPDVRLLAITGPGGVGKSQLGLAVAELLRPDFPDGVFFVPLAPLDDPALVAAAIARPLGLAERGGRPLSETVVEALHAKRLLLLLDNFEHLGSAVGLIDALLANCRGVAILATSRAALASPWCHEYPLPPLALPPAGAAVDAATMARVPAVALFIARAAATRPDFRLTAANAQAVAAICRRLDGLPLALELAAARLRLLSPAALLERLDEPFRLLSGEGADLPARQRTMRAAIAWSHDLLDPTERALFRRLTVFAGGGTIAAAEAICAAAIEPGGPQIDVLDLAERLAAQSLVRSSERADDEPRLTMFETIRSYAAEQLAAHGEEAATREHHAAYFLAFAERIDGAMGSVVVPALLEQLEREHDNLRAALRLLDERRDAARMLRLTGALRRFWFLQGHLSEGRRWFAAALALPTDPHDRDIAAARAQALDGASRLALLQSDYGAVVSGRTVAGDPARSRRPGGARQPPQHHGDCRQRAGRSRAGASLLLREPRAAPGTPRDSRCRRFAQQSRAGGDGAGRLRPRQGLLREALTIYRTLNDGLSIALVLVNLAIVVEHEGEARRAVAFYEESLALYRAQEQRGRRHGGR